MNDKDENEKNELEKIKKANANGEKIRLRASVNSNAYEYAWKLKKRSTKDDDLDKVNLGDIVTSALTIHKMIAYEEIDKLKEFVELMANNSEAERLNYVNSYRYYGIGEINKNDLTK